MRCPLLPRGHSICLWAADTASSPNMKHVWGLIWSPLMGCQNSGLLGRRASCASLPPSPTVPSSFTRAIGWPLIWATISCLDTASDTYMQHGKSTYNPKNTHTYIHADIHTHTHMNWVARNQAHSCAHSYIFISSSVAGCLPGLLQSLTEQTGFSELRHVLPALLDYYANTAPSLWYLLHFQRAPDSLVSQ